MLEYVVHRETAEESREQEKHKRIRRHINNNINNINNNNNDDNKPYQSHYKGPERRLQVEQLMTDSCTSHATSLYMAYLSLALQWLIVSSPRARTATSPPLLPLYSNGQLAGSLALLGLLVCVVVLLKLYRHRLVSLVLRVFSAGKMRWFWFFLVVSVKRLDFCIILWHRQWWTFWPKSAYLGPSSEIFGILFICCFFCGVFGGFTE